jgi:VCBS repeat-containing protein
MKTGILRSALIVSLLAGSMAAQAQSLTIGYTNCLAVDGYSQTLMNEIGQAKWYFAHASVGECIIEGVTNLHAADSGFYELHGNDATNVPPETTLTGVIYNDYRGNLIGNGNYSGDWQWKVAYFQTAVSNGWHYPTIDLALSKFCFIDIWYATSSNAVATLLNTYLNSMVSLEAAYPQTVFVYATMPVTTLNYSFETLDSEPTCDYWRNVFNESLRTWCAANNRVLFDVADIEAHDTNGDLSTFTFDGATCEELWSGDTVGGDQCCGEVGDGAHPTNYGAEELLARGFYAVAAATLSRWSGGSTNNPPSPHPVANPDSYNFTENTTLTVAAPGVLANDTDTAGYRLTAVLAGSPAHGSLTFNTNGGFTYTPATNFIGTDTFNYYATDGTSNSSVTTVRLTGLAAGALFSDNFARTTLPPWVAESGSWAVSGGMLNGDTSSGYGAAYVTNSWSNYTVQANLRFSSASAYGGGLSGRLNPATGARYAAWVYPENSAADGPLLKLVKFQGWTSWSYLGSSYMPIQQATLPGVGTNWHTLQLGFQGNQIAVSYDGNQVLNVTDGESTQYSSGAFGVDLFADSNPYTLSIENVTVTGSTTTGPRPAPVANNDSYGFTENTPLTVAAPGVLANDTDTAGYTLTAVLASSPTHGTLSLNSNGGFTYTPATNFSGADGFTYYATDGTSNSAVATVTLTGTSTTALFSDNFARTTLPPWISKSGTWTVNNGMLEGVGSSENYASVYVTNSWSNYVVQASVRFTTANGYGGGICGRLNPSSGARYAAWIYPEGSPANGPIVKLVKFQGWTSWSYEGTQYTPIQEASLSGVSTNWHTLQLSLQGNQITVSYDGNEVISASDAESTPYLSGAVGFDTFTGSTAYTFEVENLTVIP